MIGKVLAVAWREFSSTVLTKAFLIGAFLVPALAAVAIPLIIKLTEEAKRPPLVGTVAIVDKSGAVYDGVTSRLGDDGIDMFIAESSAQVKREMVEQFGAEAGMDEIESNPLVKQALDRAIAEVFGPRPTLTFERLAVDADIEAEQQRLRPAVSGEDDALVGIAVIAPDAVTKDDEAKVFGGYEFLVRAKTDDRNIDLIRRGVREAVLEARYGLAGVDASEVEALTTVGAAQREINDKGEARSSSTALNMMLPLVFMILLIMSVMVGGQYLLTTTIEEKSSRVVEVLLSAVSPMQLMTGKILGQMGVGVVMLLIYAGVGMATLVAFERADLVSADKLVYLAIYFVLAYFIFASFMAAIGSAVNELREAQSLQTPVMLTVMVPYFFWMPITRDPNSVLAVTLSMLPPMSPFAMVVRIASTEPPPFWQIALSLAITAGFALFCIWFAAKVFRVGLLMFGKPPNLKTLIRWVRMA